MANSKEFVSYHSLMLDTNIQSHVIHHVSLMYVSVIMNKRHKMAANVIRTHTNETER